MTVGRLKLIGRLVKLVAGDGSVGRHDRLFAGCGAGRGRAGFVEMTYFSFLGYYIAELITFLVENWRESRVNSARSGPGVLVDWFDTLIQ